MNGIRAKEEAAIAEWERKRGVEDEEIREACNRVAMKAFRYLEAGYDEVEGLMRRAQEVMGEAGLSGREKVMAVMAFARVHGRMLEVSGKLAGVAYARMRSAEGKDERAGWLELVDEIRGGAKRLGGPVEIVVKAERLAGERKVG